MTVAQRRAKSPIPGLVVIVLATAAVIFGVAVVRRPDGPDPLASEVAALRGMVDELQTAQEKLRRASDRTRSGLSTLEEELSSSAVTLAGLEERLQRDASQHSSLESAHTEVSTAPVDHTEALLELTAELRAIQTRINDLELELDCLPFANRAVPAIEVVPDAPADRFAGGTGEAVAIDVPVAQAATAPANDAEQPPSEDVVAAPAAADDTGAPSARATADVRSTVEALAAARLAAERHAELLAPFFGHGVEQPDGSRTREPGPMSLEALVHCGALAPLTSDVPEQNDALRTLAELASNAPNDRPLWPYGRGSRARVWYLRRDGKVDVPLAHGLLVQHGRAFVELGLLAR